MDFREFDGTNLLKLDTCIKLLPNIKPRKARALLNEWKNTLYEEIVNDTFAGVERDNYEIKVSDSLILASNDFEHIFFGDESSATLVTPCGANLIRKAYLQGLFEIKGKLEEYIVTDALVEYCDSADDILRDQIARKLHENEAKEMYRIKLTNFDEINESEFSYKLLNDIFVEQFGFKGGFHSLEIGGINVSKSVSLYKSNTGNSSDWQVVFNWIGTDGKQRSIRKDSVYSENRRNDSERNYGLHE